MNLTQIEILLNQLFDCSLAVRSAIEKNDSEEIDRLIEIKNDKLKLFQDNRKFIVELTQFKDMIEKIQEQDSENIKLLTSKKENILKQYKVNMANITVLKRYEQDNNLNGSIVDVSE